jgi:hypothetical protein
MEFKEIMFRLIWEVYEEELKFKNSTFLIFTLFNICLFFFLKVLLNCTLIAPGMN